LTSILVVKHTQINDLKRWLTLNQDQTVSEHRAR